MCKTPPHVISGLAKCHLSVLISFYSWINQSLTILFTRWLIIPYPISCEYVWSPHNIMLRCSCGYMHMYTISFFTLLQWLWWTVLNVVCLMACARICYRVVLDNIMRPHGAGEIVVKPHPLFRSTTPTNNQNGQLEVYLKLVKRSMITITLRGEIKQALV